MLQTNAVGSLAANSIVSNQQTWLSGMPRNGADDHPWIRAFRKRRPQHEITRTFLAMSFAKLGKKYSSFVIERSFEM
jgi:hypothetical protein